MWTKKGYYWFWPIAIWGRWPTIEFSPNEQEWRIYGIAVIWFFPCLTWFYRPQKMRGIWRRTRIFPTGIRSRWISPWLTPRWLKDPAKSDQYATPDAGCRALAGHAEGCEGSLTCSHKGKHSFAVSGGNGPKQDTLVVTGISPGKCWTD